jgi:hypothetical protein
MVNALDIMMPSKFITTMCQFLLCGVVLTSNVYGINRNNNIIAGLPMAFDKILYKAAEKK